MASITVSSSTEFCDVVGRRSSFDEIEVTGDFSQDVAKTFGDYYKYKGRRNKSFVAMAGGILAVAAGPIGWGIAAGLTALGGGMAYKHGNEKSFETMPYSKEIEKLDNAGFELVSNSGSRAVIRRK